MRTATTMRTGLVATGPSRLRRGKETALWESIEAKYADELASASAIKKLEIKLRMQREFLRRRKEGHAPSPGTLW